MLGRSEISHLASIFSLMLYLSYLSGCLCGTEKESLVLPLQLNQGNELKQDVSGSLKTS